MRLGLTVVACVLAGGCAFGQDQAAHGNTDDFIDQDVPPGNCSAGTSAEPCPGPDSPSPEGGPCLESMHCADGNACVAPFVGGQVGSFTCTSQCIPNDDEGSWCLDASACCDASASCSTRGLCVMGEGLDASGTSESTTDASTTDASTTDASTTDASTTDAEGGSETGAATGTTGMR